MGKHWLPHHGCLGRSHCRFEEREVAQTWRATVRSENFRLDCHHGFHGRVRQGATHASRLKSSEFF